MDNLELIKLAQDVAKNAYAPYSKFYVGAAVEFENGKIFTGCNVENASYGLSLCAERNAISNAIASGDNGKIKKIAIYSPNADKCFPCGACRQWIQEFSADTEIIVSEKDTIITHKISELLPYSFDSSYL